MNALQDRRVLAAAGGAVALLAGIGIASVFMSRGAPPAGALQAEGNTTGLQVEMTADMARQDPTRQLRCFVGGEYIGLATLADCARRNGVAAQALDVGLDQSGELAAGGEQAQLQPLPPVSPPTQVAEATPPDLPSAGAAGTPAGSGPVSECLRYGGDGWRAVGGAMTLNACVQLLFAGRCQNAGEALYGRWSTQTLRLVPGRVETSPDNRAFSPLAEQAPNCAIGPVS